MKKYGVCLVARVNVYLKVNVLLFFSFASNNIYSLGVWIEGRVHHNFAPIYYFPGVNGIRGQNIYSTCLAP
jgi:hypothetical protein